MMMLRWTAGAAAGLMAAGAVEAQFTVTIEQVFLLGTGIGEYEWVDGFVPSVIDDGPFQQSPGWAGGWSMTWVESDIEREMSGSGASSGGLIEELPTGELRVVADGGAEAVGEVGLVSPYMSAAEYFELYGELSGTMYSQIFDTSIVTAHSAMVTGTASVDYRVSGAHVIEFEGPWDDVFNMAIVLPTGPRELVPRSGMRLPHGAYRIGGSTQRDWIWPVGWPDNGDGYLFDGGLLAGFRIRFREVCLADFDGDGMTGGADLGVLLGAWGGSDGDLNADGVTDGADLGILLGAWGACP